MKNQEISSFKNLVDIRVLLSRMETDLFMWSMGYEETSLRLINQLLHVLQKIITFPNIPDESKKLQGMRDQIERMRSALLRSELVDRQLAQKLAQQIIEDLREIRHARTSVLQPIEVKDVVGAYVIHFSYSHFVIGQVVRFRPACYDKRVFGFIGDVVIRPCDEQQAMKDLFQGVYPLRDSPIPNLYHWPADFPPQTFQEPDRPKDLVTIQWAIPFQENDDDDDDRYPNMSATSFVQQAGDSLKDSQISQRINEGDGDRRIGMPLYSLSQQKRGYLKGIQIYGDGSERWIAKGDDGVKMIDESDLFWLEIRGYHQLFTPRVLNQEAIVQTLREAQQLREAFQLKAEQVGPDNQDELIQLQRRLDRIQTFLSGDMEDGQQGLIATVCQNMFWNGVSLNETQREEARRQTAIEIDRLRQGKEK